MTIEQYLRGKVDFNLTDATLAAILYDRGVTEGTELSNVTTKQKDLCLADIYMFLATSSTSSSSEVESDGGWTKQKSNKNVVNRSGFISLANSLYEKWDETIPSATTKITFKPLY